MNAVHPSNRGQVLIIFVFAIIGLIGVTGLAVDGGNILSDRRHAQNAADTAALAVALARNNAMANPPHSRCDDFNTETHTGGACSASLITTGLNVALENGYNNNLVDSTVNVYNPPIHGTYANCGSYLFHCRDYVEVSIDTNVDTFFARVLGIPQTHNKVTAVALSRYEVGGNLWGGNSMVQLRPHSTDCSGSNSGVYFGGAGTVTLNGGGVWVNSDNDTCAFKITNTCPPVILNDGADIEGIGAQFPGCSAPIMKHASPQLSYPPDAILAPNLIPPDQCGWTSPIRPSYTDGDGFTHYYPGHYAQLPPDKNTVLENGVFCVDSLVKTTSPTTLRHGFTPSPPSDPNPLTDIGGVFIYIKPGGNFRYDGGSVDLEAPTSGPYKGFLMYVDANYQNYFAGNPAPNCTINGSAAMNFWGVIYAPFCDVSIAGGSTPFSLNAQLVGYTISLTGTADLIFTYDPSKMPTLPDKNWIGLYH